jgi:hypothetical protein
MIASPPGQLQRRRVVRERERAVEDHRALAPAYGAVPKLVIAVVPVTWT